MVLKQGKMLTFGRYSELVSSSVEFLQFLDRKRREEEERRESISRQKSLSLNQAPVEEEIVPVNPVGIKVPSKAHQDINRQEVKSVGAVSARVFWDYFRSGGSLFLLISSVFFSITSQALFQFTDM